MDAFSPETEQLLRKAKADDKQALGELLTRYTGRLRRMVLLRMDSRLQGRIDVADVLQDSFIEAMRSFPDYQRRPDTSFYVWLRCIVSRKLMDLHRHHLGAQARDARREISLNHGQYPEATSAVLAAQLVGCITSPSEAAMRAERRAMIEKMLNSMSAMDREVLALRHFEQLSNLETAEILGIKESAASKRHLRALKHIKGLLHDD